LPPHCRRVVAAWLSNAKRRTAGRAPFVSDRA
jgi:hypothetical protein